MYHAAPPAYSQFALSVGGSVLIHDQFDPEAVLDAFSSGVTSAFMVPTMLQRILALPEDVLARADLQSVRSIISGGAPFPAPLRRASIGYFGEVIFDLYGSTETGLVTCLEPADQLRKPGSVGRPLDHVDIMFLDENDRPVAEGERGVIFTRCPMQIKGYHGNDEATAECRRGDFITAGDVGYRDKEGFIYVVDRVKDMIIAGGVNIYPAEIEAVIREHPAVFDVAVFGIPHPDMGEEAKAVVQLRDGTVAAAEEILEFCADRLAKYKWPRSVDFTEELPRNPSGKILKRQLRAPYWS
jgi:long-chain acyl-CoA synthetase